MEIWQDGVLAGLAAVGLTAILWLLAGLLFRRREHLLDAVYLVPLSGGAEQLDMTLREHIPHGKAMQMQLRFRFIYIRPG